MLTFRLLLFVRSYKLLFSFSAPPKNSRNLQNSPIVDRPSSSSSPFPHPQIDYYMILDVLNGTDNLSFSLSLSQRQSYRRLGRNGDCRVD
ncbi:hypothetical protein Bca101_076819 [Brassica carinata]